MHLVQLVHGQCAKLNIYVLNIALNQPRKINQACESLSVRIVFIVARMNNI